MAGRNYHSIHDFASAIPNHLLLGSLLEHLCFVYESNPARSRMLFKVIGQRLAAMNLLSPLAISDEFSTVRLQHNRAFSELLHAASSSLQKEGLFQGQISRYISEFEEICRLGKGSYGKVFKVMNKLDGQYYAVKKILIKKVSKDDCMKVLREVKVLSSLQHVNVVGYHTAWLEHVQPAASEYLAAVHFHLMFYIQMQLCERSLKDWIFERNMKPKEELTSNCPYECVDADQTFKLLKQIVEGVEYIHSRGIMHRDLKPRNIFLHGQDCYVRIGDFGLACSDIIMDSRKNTTSSGSESAHTTGVGTFVYAAPEQLKGSHYDSKSDMYSIGVLALELFQPFGTEMERACTLESLRKGEIPDSFSQRWPVLTKYIKKLTNPDPSVRPTADQLLQSELFCNKDIVHGLQKRIEEQDEVIVQLRRQISQLQSS
uniref:Eukaryotic translation initiation factor 2-alpha kinase 1 n=1 Tax=Takifugu rubripes TaxID=31033 RepID=A0A674N1L4_TAKRU